MELHILGSGSAGNGYIIQNENEAIILECGIPFKVAAKALNNNLAKVKGCLVTHGHGDHAKYIKQYAKTFNIYTTAGTLKEIHIEDNSFHFHSVTYFEELKIGGFSIAPFATQHDTSEPCGFLVYHADMGALLFATDTYSLAYKFMALHLNHIMIECNHQEELVERSVYSGTIPQSIGERIKQTHMSLDRCIDFLHDCDLSNTTELILLHMSDNNSQPVEFQKEIIRATGKNAIIAQAGLIVDLIKL